MKILKNLILKKRPTNQLKKGKFPQEYDDGGINILDDLNKKEMNDPRVQAMFKR